jgi:acetyltransferase
MPSERTEALRALFAPKSVAVIGASTRPDSLGRAVFRNILFHGYTGVVYPVNPKAKSILGVKAYPSILEVPDEVDLAVIIVPAKFVPQVLEECGEKGAKAAVVISAGFKEIGGEGERLEEELKEIAKRYGIAMLGPNCLGIINTDPEVSLNATFAYGMPRRGNIAFISQSGALGVAALEHAHRQNIGLSVFVSIGNKADLHENHLLAYLKDEPHTDVVLLYLEDLEDPKGFHDLATEITGERAKKMPLLAIKSGRTLEGAKAASSHTGALAGSDEVYDSVFIQSGVLRVESIEELFDYALAFAQQPLPKGNGMAIVTNAGGAGILATDAAIRYGLKLAELTEETQKGLREVLPPAASVSNPVDMTGDADEVQYEQALRMVLEDPNVDGAIVIATPHLLMDLGEIAQRIVRAASQDEKPVLACLMAVTDLKPAVEVLDEAGIPQYGFPERAARALAAMARYSSWVRRPRTEFRRFEVDRAKALEIIAQARSEGRRFLPEPEAHALLKAYGFPVLESKLACTEDEAVKAAEQIGYPVVLKIVSPQIVHKFDIGGVKLDLEGEEEVRLAFRELISSAEAEQAEVWGAFVQPYVSGGIETILGLKRDPHFGPLLMFGLGGIYVEALRDVTFRIAPIRELGSQRMIRQIRSYKILEGFRSGKPSDVEAIAECLLRLSQLAMEIEEIEELDINPLVVFEQGRGARVVDARILLKEPD